MTEKVVLSTSCHLVNPSVAFDRDFVEMPLSCAEKRITKSISKKAAKAFEKLVSKGKSLCGKCFPLPPFVSELKKFSSVTKSADHEFTYQRFNSIVAEKVALRSPAPCSRRVVSAELKSARKLYRLPIVVESSADIAFHAAAEEAVAECATLIEQSGMSTMMDTCLNFLKDYLKEAGVKILFSILLVPTIASFITLLTSLISCFKDKSYASGTIGIVASLTSLVYNLSIMIYGTDHLVNKFDACRADIIDKAKLLLGWLGFTDPEIPVNEILKPEPLVIRKVRSSNVVKPITDPIDLVTSDTPVDFYKACCCKLTAKFSSVSASARFATLNANFGDLVVKDEFYYCKSKLFTFLSKEQDAREKACNEEPFDDLWPFTGIEGWKIYGATLSACTSLELISSLEDFDQRIWGPNQKMLLHSFATDKDFAALVETFVCLNEEEDVIEDSPLDIEELEISSSNSPVFSSNPFGSGDSTPVGHTNIFDMIDELEEEQITIEEQSKTDDYVTLGLTSAALLMSLGVLTLGGNKVSMDFTKTMNVLRSGTVLAATSVAIYTLIAKCFLSGAGERHERYAIDIEALREDLERFYDLDTAALNSTEALRSWNALQVRYSVLNRIINEENDRNLTEMFKQVNFYYFKCHDKYRGVLSTMNSNKPRKEPVFLTLYGPPGCGKTTYISMVLKPYFCKLFDVSLESGCIEMTGENKYFPSFQGRPICIIDEYNQENPTIESITTMTKMIGGNAFKADGASLEDKDQYFNAELVITASNRGIYSIPASACPVETSAAFWDRHNFFYIFSDGQEIGNGRQKTPGSKLRFFRTNGTTPISSGLKNAAGTHFQWPATMPSGFVEIESDHIVSWIVSELKKKRDNFNMISEAQRLVESTVIPDRSLITDRKPPQGLGSDVPSGSIFTTPESIVTKTGMKIVDRLGEISDSLDKINNINISGSSKPLPDCPPLPAPMLSYAEAASTGNARDRWSPSRQNRFERRTTNFGQPSQFPQPPRYGIPPPNTIFEQSGSSPLVIGVFGRSYTGKSYSFAKWGMKLANCFNLKFSRCVVVPEKPNTSTIYLFDDTIPSQSDAYCDFWEKCDATNIIILTSNLELPKWSRKWTLFNGQYDYSHFPSERLIRRCGFAGDIFFQGNSYFINSTPCIYEMIGHGKCLNFFTREKFTEVDIVQDMIVRVSEHLRSEPEVDYVQTEIAPPETTYDIIIDIDKNKLHEVIEADFSNAVVPSFFKKERVNITITDFSSWLDPGVFIKTDLVPNRLPEYRDIWEGRAAFSGILKALLPQKKGFKLLVRVGEVSIYTTGDDSVYVCHSISGGSTITEEGGLIRIVNGDDEWYLDPVQIAANIECSPNHRDEIDEPKLKMLLAKEKETLLSLPIVKKYLTLARSTRARNSIRENFNRDLAIAIQTMRNHPIIASVVGLVLGAGVFYGIKTFFGSSTKSCTKEGCVATHFIGNGMFVQYHSMDELMIEEEAFDPTVARFKVTGNLPTYLSHDHDQTLLGKFVVHNHICENCDMIFSHGHRIHLPHESAKYKHLCYPCRKASKKIYIQEEGQLYEKAKKRTGLNKKAMDTEEYRKWKEYMRNNATRYQADYSGFEDIRGSGPKSMKSNGGYQSWDGFALLNKSKAGMQSTLDFEKVNAGNLWYDDESYTEFTPIQCLEEQSVVEHEIMRAAQPTAIDAISKKVKKNLVIFKCGNMSVHGIMTHANYGVSVAHLDHTDFPRVLSDEYGSSPIPVEIVKTFPGRDLLIFKVMNNRQWPDIRRYFVHEEQLTAIHDVKLEVIRGTSTVVNNGKVSFTGERSYHASTKNPDGSDKPNKQKKKIMEISYASVNGITKQTRSGDCGVPYMALDGPLIENPIIGIHIGITNQSGPRTVLSIVTFEDLTFTSLDEESFVESDNSPVTVQTELYGDILDNLQIPVKFITDEDTNSILTPDWAGGLLNQDCPTHDLGPGVKLFTLGHVDYMRMPAGSSKIQLRKTPWADQMIGKSDSVPAYQFVSNLSPEVQSTLKTDNFGRPSIVATRVADANSTKGVGIEGWLREEVRSELAGYYYPKIKSADGFRFYNTHEVLNGVHDISDLLRGASGIEPDASAGVFYNKAFQVHSKGELLKLTSAPGQQTNFTFNDNDAGKNLRQRFAMAVDGAKRGEQFVDLSNVKLKVELRPLQKAEAGKTRAFESEGTISYMVMKKFMGPVAQAFIKNRDQLHHTGGQNMHTEWPKCFKRLDRMPFLSGQDHETFDKTIMEDLIADAANVMGKIWVRAKSEGYFPGYTPEELVNIANAVFGTICYSFEFIEGTLVVTKGVINSGILLTNWADSVCIDLSQIYVTKILVKEGVDRGVIDPEEIEHINGFPTIGDIHSHSDWLSNGDDNLACYDEIYARVMSFSNIKMTKLHFLGMKCTPPSKDLVEYEFGDWQTESFCSRFTRGEFPYITAALKKESILRGLHWTRLENLDEYAENLNSAVLFEAMLWQDEDFYNQCLRDCEYIVEDLGLDITFKSYKQQMNLYKAQIGLGSYSEQDLELRTEYKNTEAIKLTSDSQLYKINNEDKNMPFYCVHCPTKVNSEAGALKHLGSAHYMEPELKDAIVICSWCMQELPLREYLSHDHHEFNCSKCSAKPKNLASAETHAFKVHNTSIKECFMRFTEQAGEGDFTMGNSGMPGTGLGSSGTTAANAGASSVGVVTAPPELVAGTSTVAASTNFNTSSPPPMISFGGVTASLEETVRSQMFPFKTITITSSMAAGTLVEKIQYGDCSGYFKTYLDMHRRYAGDIEYYVQVTGNAAFSGDLIVGWWVPDAVADVPPLSTDPSLFLVNWEVMTVGCLTTTCFVLSDARKSEFYRVTGADTTPKPQLLIYVRNMIMNPVGDVNGTVYVNIYHKPAPGFVFAYPKAVSNTRQAGSVPEAYTPTKAERITLSSIVGTGKGFIFTDAPNSAALPGARSYYNNIEAFHEQVYGTPLEYLMLADGPGLMLHPQRHLHFASGVPLLTDQIYPKGSAIAYSSNADRYITDPACPASQMLGFADSSCCDDKHSQIDFMRMYAAGSWKKYVGGVRGDWDEMRCFYGGQVSGAQWPDNTLYTATHRLSHIRGIMVNNTTYQLERSAPIPKVNEEGVIVLHERNSLYLSLFTDEAKPFTAGDKADRLRKLYEIVGEFEPRRTMPSPSVVTGYHSAYSRPVGGPHSVLLNVAKTFQPFVPSDYAAPGVATVPDEVTYALLDYLYERSVDNGTSFFFFDICEIGTSNTIASCKYDQSSGTICASVGQESVVNNDLYLLSNRINFNALELRNFKYTSESSEPPPIPFGVTFKPRKLPQTNIRTDRRFSKDLINRYEKTLARKERLQQPRDLPDGVIVEQARGGDEHGPQRMFKRQPRTFNDNGPEIRQLCKAMKNLSISETLNKKKSKKLSTISELKEGEIQEQARDDEFPLLSRRSSNNSIFYSGSQSSIRRPTPFDLQRYGADRHMETGTYFKQQGPHIGTMTKHGQGIHTRNDPITGVTGPIGPTTGKPGKFGRDTVFTGHERTPKTIGAVKKISSGRQAITAAAKSIGQVGASVIGGGIVAGVGAAVGGVMQGIELRDKRKMFDITNKVGFQKQKNQHINETNQKMMSYSLNRASAIGSFSNVSKNFQGRFGNASGMAGADYEYHQQMQM